MSEDSAPGAPPPRRSIAHDLRNAVHHILGCSGLLLEEAGDRGLEELLPDLRDVRAAGQQALALLDAAFPRGTGGGEASPPAADAAAGLGPALEALAEGLLVGYEHLYEGIARLEKPDLLADLEPIEAAAQQLLAAALGPASAPAAEPPPTRQTPAADRAEPAPAAEQPAGAATILVVDDSETNRALLIRRLERLGYGVLAAENGARALEVLQMAEVDLVILDIVMPEMDGYAVLERRRADARLRDIPFIVISALDELSSVVRCIEMGAEDYLTKPFEPVLLGARIGACLDKKRLHDQEKQHLATIRAQSTELAELNRTLEARVEQQVDDIVRLRRLQRFLSPQIADVIISGGEHALEPHRREITVAFCDLRGFTAFAETAEPEDVMTVLRDYHTTMGEVIFNFNGTLEHFAGDGMMIFFNDPVPLDDPAGQAVRMGLVMRERAAGLAAVWRKRGHQLAFGMGIAMGYATLGRIGFEGRFDYGAIGTVTNLASRLCSEAAPGQILVSARVCTCVEDEVELEPVGELELRGFVRPVPAYNAVRLRSTP